MSLTAPRLPGLVAAALLALSGQVGAATGPFGVGLPEAAVAGTGLFGWIAARQSEFYKALTAAIHLLHSDPWAAATLVGLSFAYGVLHAAGPGHGKAVVSAYVLANGETLKRGILIAFLSAFLQAATAIILVGIAARLLRLTAMAMTEATLALELASGALVTLLGLYLLARALLNARRSRPDHAFRAPEPAPEPAVPAANRPGLRYRGKVVVAEVCVDCGAAHAPDPATLTAPLSLKSALGAILSVGLRPCTGALIVLTFAFAQGLWWAGILSALAMAAGTGITVALIAALSVFARAAALRFARLDSAFGLGMITALRTGGALAILAVGLLILGAGLAGAPVSG